MPRRILIASILFLFIGSCFASTILEVTGSARSLGMGGKSVVTAKNIAEITTNPASLASLGNRQIGSSYANLFFEEIGFTFLGGAVPLAKDYSFGATYRQIKTDVDYDSTYLESVTTFTLSRKLKSVALGATLSTLKTESEFWEGGYSLDLGITKALKQGQMGFSIKNAYSHMNATTEHSKLDPYYYFGIAYYPQSGSSITFEVDNFKYLSVGLESAITEDIDLRLGVNDRGFAGGVGFTLGHWGLDYALFDNGMGVEHRVTTTFRL